VFSWSPNFRPGITRTGAFVDCIDDDDDGGDNGVGTPLTPVRDDDDDDITLLGCTVGYIDDNDEDDGDIALDVDGLLTIFSY
jgi:hypothetical protein